MAKSMPVQLQTFTLTSSKASSSATSLPVSEAGAMPSDLPDGMTRDLFGRVVAPANPSVRRAPTLGAMIPAIFGQRGFASSASADLTQSLVSRLKARLPTDGSTLFAMTWKEKATPSGRLVYRLVASGHRTSDKGYGSWPSPTGPAPHDTENTVGRSRPRKGYGVDLEIAASWASWPSPAAQEPGGTLEAYRQRNPHHDGGQGQLSHAAQLASWQTPKAVEVARSPEFQKGREALSPLECVRGPTSSGSPAETAKPAQLNPAFSRWLMGYSAAWDSCGATAMRLSRTLRRKS